MKRGRLHVLMVFLLVLALAAGCTQQPAPQQSAQQPASPPPKPSKDKLVFGGARSQSGPFALFDQIAFGPIYRMWADEVNKAGGIYVKEFDKKLPIELKIYDDTSDLGTMTRLLEKLMVEDRVDFILPPVSTAFLYAAAPIANKHGYILMGAEGGSATLNVSLARMPYFFSILNHSETQVPAMVDVLSKAGIKKAAVIFISDLHGVEYSGAALPQLALAGIDVVFSKSVPPGISDLSPIIKEAMKANVDAFLAFVYPDEGFLALKQATELGFSPKVFLIGPGGNFEFFKNMFGKAAEGVMCWGAWNEKSSPAAAEFVKKFVAFTGKRDNIDWWGHLPYYASLQILQQAIERTGTLDHAKIAECIRTQEFDTVLGKSRFANGTLAPECYTGQLGQWQNGVFEVIAPADKATARPVIPRKVAP